jgi:hypothetical protein
MNLRHIPILSLLLACASIVLAGCGRQEEPSSSSDVAALSARLSELETKAERLKDINAIKRLQRSYGYYVDNAMWDEVVDLLTDDCTFEIALDGVYIGKESIRKYLYALSGGQPGLQAGVINEHMQLQPVIDVAEDGRTAKGRWRALIMNGTWGERATWGEGPYENAYVKEDGIWKIKSIHWYETFVVPYEGGWAAQRKDLHDGKFVSDTIPSDAPPSEKYDVWPGVYLPPYHYKNPVTGK